MNFTLSFDVKQFTLVMLFYAVISYILFPLGYYFMFGQTLEAAGNGFILGSILSIVLWKFYGFKMVKG
jgi:hypothetical protein